MCHAAATSGGVTTLQILGMLASFDIAARAPGSADAVHLVAEASKLAFADRAVYLADTDFVAVPVEGLLDETYLRQRAAAIGAEGSPGPAQAGEPPFRRGLLHAPGDSHEQPATTHFSIVDGKGNAVAMTSSIENVFGSRLMVRGFLLNNQLTDFSFRPERDGVAVVNRVEAGKRPRSSMSPTLVFDESGDLFMAIGSPGAAASSAMSSRPSSPFSTGASTFRRPLRRPISSTAIPRRCWKRTGIWRPSPGN